MEKDCFAWFVVLPKNKTASCLGLLNKYTGFMAVESIHEKDDAQTIVIRESGLLGWISEREPEKVIIDTDDVTGKVQKKDNLYSLLLPETFSKTVLSIVW